MNRNLILGSFAALSLLLSACAGDVASEDGSADPGAKEDVGEADSALLPSPKWQWTSDELPAAVCPNGYVVDAMECTGSNCDNVGLRCGHLNRTYSAEPFSGFISEEAPNNWTKCSKDRFMVGLQCNGNNCDNVAIECAPFASTTRGPDINCYWTSWFSEEQQTQVLIDNYAAAGIACRGNNCDDMRMWACEILPHP